MTRPPGGDEIFAFGERLLALLEEASYSTTYKLAVLLALIDLCMEHSRRDGSAPTTVTTRQLAEKVLELYWPQAVPFGARTGAVVLAQSNGGQAEILTAIVRFRDAHAPDAGASIARARRLAPGRLERLVREIEWKLVEMPLPRLQRVGREDDPFLYRIAWNERITRREFDGPGFDNRILFTGSAGNHLVQLLGLLRPLVQRRWAGMAHG